MRASIVLAALCGTAVSAAVSAVEAVGSKFYKTDGTQFFIKGVAYQLVEDDPLVDTEQCVRDATLMKTLGVNTIRVYHVDPNADHSGCMSAFADAGIYTLIDMDTFSTYILPYSPSWTKSQFDAYAKVMDAFAKYDNVLGLFVGNEIIAKNDQSLAAPFIKAASRDLKAYRNSKGYRKIPIGYSAADIAELRPMLQDYLTCGGNSSENIDFFGLNSYSWCDPASYLTSGYVALEVDAANFPVPIFFSETGCNTPGPRLFEDQAAIFGQNMTKDWSGSIIYEWIEETNHYGLISYGPKAAPNAAASNVIDGFTRKGTPTPIAPDFDNLKKQWATLSPTGVPRSAYDVKSVSTRDCPKATPGGWLVNGNVAVPSLGVSIAGTPTFSSMPVVTITPSPTSGGSSSGSGTGTGSAAATSSTRNAVSGSKEIAGMGTGLVGVMLLFTFWL